MHPTYAAKQLLVQDDYWLNPYPEYMWIFAIFAVILSLLIEIRRSNRWLYFVTNLTLGFVCLHYSIRLRADFLETVVLRLPFSTVSEIAAAVSAGKIL